MNTTIRSTAATLGALIFFVMAIVGSICGHSPAICCNRALIGAVITYIVISIAGKSIMNIIINQIVENKVNRLKPKDKR